MNAPFPELQAAADLWRQGQNGAALAQIMQVIRQYPMRPAAWELASYFLISRKKWAEAAKLLAPAVETFPGNPLLNARYALVLGKLGDLQTAATHAAAALQTDPHLTEGLLARIEILADAGYYDAALADSAKLAGKNIPETAAITEGVMAFLCGETARGLPLIAAATKSGWRGKNLPEWHGEPDAHLVLYNGQGYGDLIQFSRYLKTLKSRAAKISLLAPTPIATLVRESFPDIHVIFENEHMDVPDDATHRCQIMSLALDNFDPLPGAVPYLHADATRRAAWRQKLAHLPRPYIGIAWTSPWQMNSPLRTVTFDALKPVLDCAAPHLISLQIGPEAKPAIDAGLFDAAPHIKDFSDSAALISELDLLITLDSAPAHLAGALGTAAWTFLPFSAEWRWLVAREDCVWYPSMRLYRQKQPQDWRELFTRMTNDLQKLLAGDSNVLKPHPWQGTAPRRHPDALPLPPFSLPE